MQPRLLAGASAAGALSTLALVLAIPSVASATAATNLGGCGTTDVGPNAAACSGFYAGNQLGGSADQRDTQAAALAALGFVGAVTQIEHIDLNGPKIDFSTLLNGTTFIGIHWGKGEGPLDAPGGGTGFYRLDLADNANLDVLVSAFGSQSAAVLFRTGPCEGDGCGENPGGGVPEPATWTMMIIGFGGTGALVRRRRVLMRAA